MPDAQSTVAEAAAVCALVHTLVAWLAERHDAGEPLETADTWRLEENRWRAARWGMDAELADLAHRRAACPRASASPRCWRELAPVAAGSAARPSWPRSSRWPRATAPSRQRELAAGAAVRARSWRGSRTPTCRARDYACAAREALRRADAVPSRAATPPRRCSPRCAPRPHRPAADPAPRRARPARRRGPPARALPLLRAALPRPAGRRRALGVVAVAARAARRARGALRGRPARRRSDRCPPRPRPGDMDLALRAIADADDGPSLSRHVERDATLEQVLEFLVHRSAYQLKEADPHSWALPRLERAAEGGARRDPGRRVRRRPARARARAAVRGRDGRRSGSTRATARYVDHVPAVTLATVNLMSLCGLHRRLRGAIVGHLALFEMTSSIPNRRYAAGLRRLGFDDPAATAFFDEHVEADAVHESIAAVDLAGGLARLEPAHRGRHPLGRERARRRRGPLGAAGCSTAWADGRSSLRRPLARSGTLPLHVRGTVPSGVAAVLGAARRREAHEPVRCRRRTGAGATCRSGRARRSRARRRSRCRPGRGCGTGRAPAAGRRGTA